MHPDGGDPFSPGRLFRLGATAGCKVTHPAMTTMKRTISSMPEGFPQGKGGRWIVQLEAIDNQDRAGRQDHPDGADRSYGSCGEFLFVPIAVHFRNGQSGKGPDRRKG